MSRLYLCWPFRAPDAPPGANLAATFEALARLGLDDWRGRATRAGPVERWPGATCGVLLERTLATTEGAAGWKAQLVAHRHGRPRGSLRLVLWKERPRAAWCPNELAIEHRGRPVAPARLREAMRALTEIWGPLWGFCGTRTTPEVPEDPEGDGAPVVGWLSFLSRAYGPAPADLAPPDLPPYGSIFEARCDGRFDPAAYRHRAALARVRGQLRKAGVLQPLAALEAHGLTCVERVWRADGALPPAALAPAPTVTVATPTYLKNPRPTGAPAWNTEGVRATRGRLEPIAALGGTAPLDERAATRAALPFAPGVAGGSANVARPARRRAEPLEKNPALGGTAPLGERTDEPAHPFETKKRGRRQP